MIVDNQDPFCNAIRIETVLRSLSDWKYPTCSPGPTTAAPDRWLPATSWWRWSISTTAPVRTSGHRRGRPRHHHFVSVQPARGAGGDPRPLGFGQPGDLPGRHQGSVSGAARLGKLLDATAIVTGSVNRYDVERRVFEGHGTSAATDLYRMSVTLQVIDIESGEVRFPTPSTSRGRTLMPRPARRRPNLCIASPSCSRPCSKIPPRTR